MSANVIVLALSVGLALANASTNCEERCKAVGMAEACSRGCRLFKLGDANDALFKPLGGKHVLDRCQNDCKQAYTGRSADCDACCSGCRYQSEASKNQQGDGGGVDVSNFFDLSGLFNNLHEGPGNFLGIPLLDDGKVGPLRKEGTEEEEEEGKGQVSIFDDLHSRMSRMMNRLLNRPLFGGPPLGGTSMPLEHSGGELVVIKSGPGYHEKQTYHLGPNANIEKIIGSSMDDMMNHKNPMEKFEDINDVEIFDPTAMLDKNKDSEVKVKNDLFHFDTDPWGLLKGPMEEPKLPETGLRSRFAGSEPEDFDVGRFVIVENSVCSQDSSKMGWSDWLACLHVRMGLPNWLLAASVALGVLFAMWLCMVIPTSAPKQRVRKGKMVGTKEVEASEIYTIVPADAVPRKVDLPPSYDDVTKTPEPVHECQVKIALTDDDDEIVEPLPEKKGENAI